MSSEEGFLRPCGDFRGDARMIERFVERSRHAGPEQAEAENRQGSE